jgi:hypothetical protein
MGQGQTLLRLSAAKKKNELTCRASRRRPPYSPQLSLHPTQSSSDEAGPMTDEDADERGDFVQAIC